jgi:glycosyltransferase involved in cell wall biosynthesis
VPDLTFIIPCYNEEIYINQIINDIKAWSVNKQLVAEIIVGDNNSSDKSHQIALDAGATVISVLQKGYGNVVREASKYAKSDLLIFMDADGQHKVEDLDPIIQKLTAGADLVIGNRFSSSQRTHSTSFLKEYVGNPVLTRIGKFLFNSKINDFHSGFRGIKKAVFNSLNLTSAGFELCSEMIARAEVQKFRIEQVPISVSQPFLGRKSNIRPIIDGFKHLKCLFNIAIQNKQYFRLLMFLLAINGLFLTPFIIMNGPIITADTVTYDGWSNRLITSGVSKIIGDSDYVFSKVFYLAHLSFIAFCKMIAGNYWTYMHFASNFFLHVLTGILIFYNSYKLTKDGAVAILSNILFYFSIDSIKITCCLLSDTNFIFLINLLFAVYLSKSFLKQYLIPSFLALLVIVVFYRPTGVNVLATSLLFIGVESSHFKVSKKVVHIFLTVAGLCLLFYNAYVLGQGPEYIEDIPLKFLRTKFQYDAAGVIVWDRYIVDQIFANNYLESSLFYLEKFARFFQFYVPQYSSFHNVSNLLFFIPAYLSLFFVMVTKSFNQTGILIIIFFIFTTALFHVFTVIDFDWRYRLVLIPFLCNIFAIGFQKILNKYE